MYDVEKLISIYDWANKNDQIRSKMALVKYYIYNVPVYPDLLFQNNTNFPTIRMACKLGWLATVL